MNVDEFGILWDNVIDGWNRLVGWDVWWGYVEIVIIVCGCKGGRWEI